MNNSSIANIDISGDEAQRSIAFIAAFQASNLLYLLNTRGEYVDNKDYKVLLNSCFIKEYDSVLDLYGGNLNNLYTGFDNYLSSFKNKSHDVDQDKIDQAKASIVIFIQLVKIYSRILKDKKSYSMLLNMIDDIDNRSALINQEGRSMQKIISSDFENIIQYKRVFLTRLVLSEIILNAAYPDIKDMAYCTAYAAIRAIHIWRQHGGSVFKNILLPKGKVEPLKLVCLLDL